MMIDRAGFKSRGIGMAAFLPIFFALAGCSLIEVAPIQMGRVVQLETYRQTYDFGEIASAGIAADNDDFDPKAREINHRIEQMFTQLLGKGNWQTIKDLYGFSDIRDELVDKTIYVKGVAQFYLSIDPYNHQKFMLEGTGRYFLIREKTGAILLSGDFIAQPTSYDIADLDNEVASINVLLFTTRIPGELTYFNEATVNYQIKIDASRKNDRIYRINYGATHDVHLLRNKDELVSQKNKLGELTFDNKEQGSAKLWDLRGIKFLSSDY